MSEIILEMNHITKKFSGVKALDDVNLKVEKGETILKLDFRPFLPFALVFPQRLCYP